MKLWVFSLGFTAALGSATGCTDARPDARLDDDDVVGPVVPDDDDDDDGEEPVSPGDLDDLGSRPSAAFSAPPARVRRLLDSQYRHAVTTLVGPVAGALALPPTDVPLNGFISVGAAELALSGVGVDRYEESAAAVAAAASVDPASPARAICAEGTADCYTRITRSLGRRAFRRTLTNEEVSAFAGLATRAHDEYVGLVARPFEKGVEFLLYALLQSPNFLYIVEAGEAGQPEDARTLTGAELATRLSFFLTNQPPSDELLDAGEAGQLSSLTAREAMVRELLATPAARQSLRNTFAERLQIKDLGSLNRPEPALTPSVRQAMLEETLRLVDDVVFDRDADLRELFTSTTTFVNDELAGYYGFALPGSGAQFARVPTPPAEGRAGLLTRGAFLTRFAHNNRSSPTLRGKFIRENLLCAAVPAAPNDVETTLPESNEVEVPMTTRDRMAAHITEARCAACHEAMDPLGFSLEHFDQYGRYRTHENGLPVDASAGLDGDLADGAAGFMGLLNRRSDMVSCVVRGLYRHGLGSLEEEGQAAALYDVDTAVLASGMRLKEALVAIALSDTFDVVSLTAAPTAAPEEE